MIYIYLTQTHRSQRTQHFPHRLRRRCQLHALRPRGQLDDGCGREYRGCGTAAAAGFGLLSCFVMGEGDYTLGVRIRSGRD